jgi:hypothetical protein
METVKSNAVKAGYSQFYINTTNDNLMTHFFYQKRVFKVMKIASYAIEKSRILKPPYPLTGYIRIPMQDEIVLEMSFSV